ncbi:MAG: type II toxin-antitoxin system RelE/ParE family toxin [Isosphaeraceae bacterium]|nr:type II toxin-antitoxin system RelE/ParE family toxin [Isosphaeraceae bacterium]
MRHRRAGRLLAQRNLGASRRFYEATERAFQQLAHRPGPGAPLDSDNPHLAGLRCSTVPGYKKYLIFYRPIENGIEVLRVIHGARDIESLFEQDAKTARGPDPLAVLACVPAITSSRHPLGGCPP